MLGFVLPTLRAQTVFALSGNQLLTFNAATPSIILSSTNITGVDAGYELSGMDFRPATGELYALGYEQATGNARLYTINKTTAVATAIGAAPAVLDTGILKIGFDFNPTVDRIRVTGSNNSNYRLHPVTGALVAVDGDLAFAPTDPNAGADPSIGAVAYTNSYIGATATTLFNFDDSLGILTTQIPPNNGTLNTVGSLGIALNLLNQTSDMDIWTDAMTGTNMAFFVSSEAATFLDILYSINLQTGLATSIGLIGTGLEIDDIAVEIVREVPEEITGHLVLALTSNNNLISFDSDLPGVVRNIVPVTGITAGQILAGMDYRPATGELYALGYNNMTGEARLYTINAATGVATAIGAAPVMLEAGMNKIGFDFNPTVDRIRVTGSNNANYRLHPVTGAIAATDADLAFAAGDVNAGVDPSVGAVAYTNSYIGSTATTLFNYEDSLNVITRQDPPNNGVLNTRGSTGIMLNPADPSADMDIYFDAEASANLAFLNANAGTSMMDGFYSLDLNTGSATLIGKIGLGIAVTDIALQIERVVPDTIVGRLVYAVTSNNNLISFDSERPEIIREIVAITGITANQTLVGVDFRPATGELFGLGYNAAGGETRLYNINRSTGVATPIGDAPISLALGNGPVAVDFNPTVDRIRVVGANNANYRLNPTNGALAATDANLAYASGDVNAGTDPAIGSVAYTNSYNGATMTTLYTYDDSLNTVNTQIPPNNGTQNTIGMSGVMVNPNDPSSDLDIYYDFSTATNEAYLAANTGAGVNDNFYKLDLASGAATQVGKIGNGIAVRDIAVFLDSVVIITSTENVLLSAIQIGVSPNPASDQTVISFELEESMQVRIDITDITGRVVSQLLDAQLPAGVQNITCNVAALPQGVYLAQIRLGLKGLAIARMVRQ